MPDPRRPQAGTRCRGRCSRSTAPAHDKNDDVMSANDNRTWGTGRDVDVPGQGLQCHRQQLLVPRLACQQRLHQRTVEAWPASR